MFLCIDPGSKYLGYVVIANTKIYSSGVINIFEKDTLQKLTSTLQEQPEIHTVLIEKGEIFLREYEEELINFFRERQYCVLIYQAKDVRKKLKLERHPSSLSLKAKTDLIQYKFPEISINNMSDHEIDSTLLYLYNQKIS